MRTFEVGKRYGEHAVVFEIVKRTAKTITYAAVQHCRKIQREKRRAKDSESKKLGRQRSIFRRKPDGRSVRQARWRKDSAAATEAAGCGFKSRPVHYWESNYKFIPDTRRNTT